MKKRNHVSCLVFVLLVVLCLAVAYSQGVFGSIDFGKFVHNGVDTSGTLNVSAEPTAEPTIEPTIEPTVEPTVEPTPEVTATPIPEPEYQFTMVGNQNVIIGDEKAIIEYVNGLNQQEWLDFAIITDETREGYNYYGRIKEGETIVKDENDVVVTAGDAESCEELLVLRAGNAFIIEDEFGNVTEGKGNEVMQGEELVELVDTMSDSDIYEKAYYEKEQAIYKSAALAKVFPTADNIPGSLKLENGFNPELLSALMLVKYQTIAENGETITVYAIEWKVFMPTEEVPSGNDGGSSGGDKPADDPTQAPIVTPTPTIEPTQTPTPKPTPTIEPTQTPTPKPTPTPTPKPTEAHEEDRTKEQEEHENDRTQSDEKHQPERKENSDLIKEYPDAPITDGVVSKDDDVFTNTEDVIKEYDEAPVTSGNVSSDPDEFDTEEANSADRQLTVMNANVAVASISQEVEISAEKEEHVEREISQETTQEMLSNDRQPSQSNQNTEVTTAGEVSEDEDEFAD